jgi:glucose-6-phosphate isomerase
VSELVVDLAHAGVAEAELLAYGPALRAELERLDGAPEGEFLRVPHQPGHVRQMQAVRRTLPDGLRDVVQLGIGGSSLGAQTLCAALLPARHNERVGRDGLRCHLPDNVDPESFAALLERLDPKKTLVHVVSKSGGTLEPAAQLFALLEKWRRAGGAKKLASHFVVTTGRTGSLRAFAEREGIPILDFPEAVGGRFSVFTASGLFVPALCGIPVARVLAGARAMDARCRGDAGLGPAGRLAALYWLQDQKRERRIHVELIYGDALICAGDWFRQLWAESLGKQGRGPTPVVARGTTDQHSLVQLFVDGPDDKLYTVLRSASSRAKLRIGRDAEPAVLRGRDMGELFRAEAQGTIEALVDRGRPLVDLRFPRVTPEGLGELLMLQQMQTALAAALYGVYAFDQPGVEAGKVAAVRILSGTRPG